LVVTEVASKDVYRVAGLKAENGRRYSTTVHVSHIKGYHLPETDDEAEETTTEDQEEERSSMEELERKETITGMDHDPGEPRRPARNRKPPVWHGSYNMKR
jgi:hypothetical protein